MAMIAPDLVRRLKRLRLGGLLPTLPDRATAAQQSKLNPLEFLELCLQDEIDRRDSHGLATRVAAAGFEELVGLEQVTWETPVAFDRPRVRELFTLAWVREHENVIFCGPVGVGQDVPRRARWATARAGPAPASASSRSPGSCRRSTSPGPTTPSTGSSGAGWRPISSSSTTSASGSSGRAVERLLRRPGGAAHPRVHDPDQQPRRRRVGRPLRRPDPRRTAPWTASPTAPTRS